MTRNTEKLFKQTPTCLELKNLEMRNVIFNIVKGKNRQFRIIGSSELQ